MSDKKKVFIVGPGRSGTSLLRTILNRHPEISIAPETHFLDVWLPRLYPSKGFSSFRWEDYKSSDHFTRLGISPSVIEPGKRADVLFESLILAHSAVHKGSVRVVGEKTPAHHHYIKTLLGWFPDALILFSSRDPRGVVASLKTLNESWAEKSVTAATRDWKQAIASFNVYTDHPQVKLVPFEDLLSNPRRTVSPLLEVLGLNWKSKMLKSEMGTRRYSNNSVISLSPIDASRRGSWKNRLNGRDVATIETIAFREMEMLGYKPVTSKLCRMFMRLVVLFKTGVVIARNAFYLVSNADLRARRTSARKNSK